MGGEHVEHGRHGDRRDRRGRGASRHRASGIAGPADRAVAGPADRAVAGSAVAGSADGAQDGPDRGGAAAQRFSFNTISTAALIMAAAALMALGLVARWVSHSEEAGSALPATRVVPREAAEVDGSTPTPEPSRTARSSGASTPTRTITAGGEPSRELVVVPDSECHRFVETRQEFPTVTISVENLCQ